VEHIMPISRTIAAYETKGSWIRKLFEEGMQMMRDGTGLPVYDLSIGNPELEPPAEFKRTLRRIIEDDSPGQHRYMSNAGYMASREAVADSLAADHGLPFKGNNVVMTVGAGGAVNISIKAVLDPGEEVICVAPHFVEYRFYIENHGGVMVVAQSAPGFDLDLGAIAAKISTRTRAVLITNPNNPTGVVYPQATLDGLGDLLRRESAKRERPIFLIDDAPYRKLVYDMDKCTSSFNGYENTLVATSHSKDLGLPGERIGFLAVSPRMKGWQKVVGAAVFSNRVLGYVNAPALMQRTVTELQTVTVDLEWYRRKRDRLCAELQGMGYELVVPGGAFYVFPKAPGGDDVAFCQKLKSERVLAVPGTGFGAPGYFRVGYCVADEKIWGALPAFEKVIRAIRG
jgi:aspartate aminotransferase